MSSPFDRENWNRPPGRDDNWDRERRNVNRGRPQTQRQQPEYVYEEDEDEYEYEHEHEHEHEHDHDHDHHHFRDDDDEDLPDENVRRYTHRAHRHDEQFLDRERGYPGNEFIPERSRRMGSLLGIFERPEQEQGRPIRRPVRAEYVSQIFLFVRCFFKKRIKISRREVTTLKNKKEGI